VAQKPHWVTAKSILFFQKISQKSRHANGIFQNPADAKHLMACCHECQASNIKEFFMFTNVSIIAPASAADCLEAQREILHPIYRAACLWTHVSDCVLPTLAKDNSTLRPLLGRNARRRQAEMAFDSLVWLSHRQENGIANPAELIITYLQSNADVLAMDRAGGKHAGGQRMGMVPCPWCNHDNNPRISEPAPLAGAIPAEIPHVNLWGDWMRFGLQAIWKLQEILPTNTLVDNELRARGGRCFREAHCTPKEVLPRTGRKGRVLEILGTPQFVNSMLGSAFLLKNNGLTTAWENCMNRNPASNLADFGKFLTELAHANAYRQPIRNSVAVLKAEKSIVAGMNRHPDHSVVDRVADHREVSFADQEDATCPPTTPGQAAARQLLSHVKQDPYALAISQGLSQRDARIFEFFANHILEKWSVDEQRHHPELHEELAKNAIAATCREFGIDSTTVYSIRRRCRP
jgi:hypothetical protein